MWYTYTQVIVTGEPLNAQTVLATGLLMLRAASADDTNAASAAMANFIVEKEASGVM